MTADLRSSESLTLERAMGFQGFENCRRWEPRGHRSSLCSLTQLEGRGDIPEE